MLILALLYGTAFAALNVMGARANEVPADCILIPGAMVEADGQPGRSLQGRLDHALELYKAGLSKYLVTTGGRGESGPIEAEASRDYLVARGVPAAAVVLENMSHTTWENFTFAAVEMRRNGWTSCLVVTDPFHMERCLAMASEAGLVAYPAPSFTGPGWTFTGSLYYTTREIAAWAKYIGDRAGRR